MPGRLQLSSAIVAGPRFSPKFGSKICSQHLRTPKQRSFAEPELKGPPTLKKPSAPVVTGETSDDVSAAAGAWKAPDKAEEEKQLQIRLKAEAERKRMEQAESARKLRDARREIRDFSNSLNDLWYEDLGEGKLPQGVKTATRPPQDSETQIGFNPTAEILNSRAAMIGFFAVLLIEGITGKGILTFLGLKIGSGIDIGL